MPFTLPFNSFYRSAILPVCLLLAACDAATLTGSGTEVDVQSGDNTDNLSWDRPTSDALDRTVSNLNAGELLINPDFSDQLNGWATCNSQDSIQGSDIRLSANGCIHQSIDSTIGQEILLSCDARLLNSGNSYVGLSFYDESWNFIAEPPATRITSTTNDTYTVTGTAPSGTRYAGAWIFTAEGAAVSRCSLTNLIAETTPPAPAPTTPTPTPAPTTPAPAPAPTAPSPSPATDFCPAYDDSPLYRPRSNLLVLSPSDSNWRRQIEQAQADTEIVLMDGVYQLGTDTVLLSKPDVTIRSLSGNRDNVTIRGGGINVGTSEGFMIAADRVTISDLSMTNIRRHAIAMKPGLDPNRILDRTYIYNVNIYDIGTQHIKGADSGENRDAVIACSRLGYTSASVVRGDYIGGIGIFEGSDVIVRDNYLYNFSGDGTGCNVAAPESACIYDSAPAIYMRISRDSVIERNTVINSWRGISLGLTNGHVRGIVRNNFVYRSEPGDMGISIEKSTNTIVENNTVFVEGYWAPIQTRGGSGHIFRNNLTSLPIQLRGGTTDVSSNGNIEYATVAELVSPTNVHLKANSIAIGAGVAPITATTDIDGQSRSGRWDVGADHFSP